MPEELEDYTSLSALSSYIFDEEEEQEPTPEPEVDPQPEADPQEPENDPEPQNDPEADPEPEPEADPETDDPEEGDPEPEVDPENDPQSDPDPEPEFPFSDITSSVAEYYGIQLSDEERPENTFEGLVNFVETLAKSKAEETNDFANDEVKQINDLVRQGGSLETYLRTKYEKPFDVNNISLDSDDDLLRAATFYYKSTTKMSPERISKQVKLLKDSGELKDFVETEAVPGINEFSKEREEQYKQRVKAEADQKKQANAQRISAAKEKILSKKTLAGVNLNEDTKQEFIEFLYGGENGTESGYVKLLKENPEIELDMLYVAFQNRSNPKGLAQKIESNLVSRFKKNLKNQDKNVKGVSKKGKLSGKQQGPKGSKKGENDWINDSDLPFNF